MHPSKWPQLVVYASNLPKTTTGKAMRTKLDKRLSPIHELATYAPYQEVLARTGKDRALVAAVGRLA